MYHDPDGYDPTDCEPIRYHDCEHCNRFLFDVERCKCRTCTACEKAERLPGEELCADCRKLYCTSCGDRIALWAGDGRCGECVRDEHRCGHSACSQHYVDTGDRGCLVKAVA